MRRSKLQHSRTPRPLFPRNFLLRLPLNSGHPCPPAVRRPPVTQGSHTMVQSQLCLQAEDPILELWRRIPAPLLHPRDFLHPSGGLLGCCPFSHTLALHSLEAGRMATPRLPTPTHLQSLLCLPQSLLTSLPGHRSLRKGILLMAETTETGIWKTLGGRLRPLSTLKGSDQPLDTSVCSETGPLLPMAGFQIDSPMAGVHGCSPPAPPSPLRPPEFSPGSIPSQLPILGLAQVFMKTGRLRSHFLPLWSMTTGLPHPGSPSLEAGTLQGEAPKKGPACTGKSLSQSTPNLLEQMYILWTNLLP